MKLTREMAKTSELTPRRCFSTWIVAWQEFSSAAAISLAEHLKALMHCSAQFRGEDSASALAVAPVLRDQNLNHLKPFSCLRFMIIRPLPVLDKHVEF